jgi:hypothetical protein
MEDIIAKIYGAGGGRPVRPQQAQTPDWSAGASGDTVGGIGNTAAMGEDINWGTPDRSDTTVGQVVDTPAGKYKVVETADGFALEPMEGALRGVSPTLNNFTAGAHHLGINPLTGEMWYQQAKSIPSQFSQGMFSAPQTQQPPSAGNESEPAGGGSEPAGGGSAPDESVKEQTLQERIQTMLNNITSLFNDPRFTGALNSSSTDTNEPEKPTRKLSVTNGLFGDRI